MKCFFLDGSLLIKEILKNCERAFPVKSPLHKTCFVNL